MRLFQDGETYENMSKKLKMSRCSVIVIHEQLGLPARNQRKEKVRNEHWYTLKKNLPTVSITLYQKIEEKLRTVPMYEMPRAI